MNKNNTNCEQDKFWIDQLINYCEKVYKFFI